MIIGIDWNKYSWLCYDPNTDKDKMMKEKQLTCPMAEHGEWTMSIRTLQNCWSQLEVFCSKRFMCRWCDAIPKNDEQVILDIHYNGKAWKNAFTFNGSSSIVFRSIEDDKDNPISEQVSLAWTMEGTTQQIVTVFHHKIIVSNDSWLHVTALSSPWKILSLLLQL